MKIVNNVRNAINRGNFKEARKILEMQSQNLPTSIGPMFSPERETQIDTTYSDLRNDYGSGRFSRGMIFLELVSLSKKGKNLESVLLFDRIPQYSNVKSMDTITTDTEKANFIATSVGVENLVDELRIFKKDLYDVSEDRLVEVFDEVNSGQFLRKNNEDFLPFYRRSTSTLKLAKQKVTTG